MDTIKSQQIALDDALVAPVNRLKIGKFNHRLSSTLKSDEPTIQVVLDALKLTPFYKAFEISANVPEIYMQEFWANVSIHHKSLHFKMNEKIHTLNLENFRDMLQIWPRLPGQKFKDPILEEEILSFIRDLGYIREIKIVFACHVLKSFGGMYHKKNVDYVYLLWEDLDQSISRTNKLFWHTARDDPMFNTIRVISRHQDTQIYGAILPNELTNQEMLDSKAYKEYYAVASGAKPPKAKKSSRLKSLAKVAKINKKKQPGTIPKTKGLAILSKVALTESEVPDEQQQKVTSTNEGAGDTPEEDADEETYVNDDSEGTKSDNDRDDLTHTNLSTYKADDKEEEEKADDEEMSSYQRVLTPPEYELTEEEENKEGDDKDKEGEQEQYKEDDLYRDVNINLERSDAEMTDAQANKDTEDAHVTLTIVPPVAQQHSSSVSSDLVLKFINPSPDTGIDSILNPNIQSHTLVNVPVSVNAETPSSDTTIPPPPIPIIQPLQQIPKSTTTTIIPTISMPDIPDFASVFRFDQRVSTLEIEMFEFKQTNQFANAVSSISEIVDNYLASKMKEVVDVTV
ncbi:hypothetical protein Tco_0085017 [Tanacetum coccineum]